MLFVLLRRRWPLGRRWIFVKVYTIVLVLSTLPLRVLPPKGDKITNTGD
jgi:hypothetical protein